MKFPGRFDLGFELPIYSLLIIRHDTHAIAVLVDLGEIIGEDASVLWDGSTVVSVLVGYARFDGTHEQLGTEALLEFLEEQREIIFCLGVLELEIDVDAVVTLLVYERGNLVYERGP